MFFKNCVHSSNLHTNIKQIKDIFRKLRKNRVMIVHKSDFSSLIIPDNFKTIIQNWHQKTKRMSDKQFLIEMKELKEIVREHQPECILINIENFCYLISPRMQKWVNKNVSKTIVEFRIKKVAFIEGRACFAGITVNQTFTEDEALALNSKFFKNESDAKKWLGDLN